jgi:hypothetical protein
MVRSRLSGSASKAADLSRRSGQKIRPANERPGSKQFSLAPRPDPNTEPRDTNWQHRRAKNRDRKKRTEISTAENRAMRGYLRC